MANYYLLSIKTDAETLEAIRAEANMGGVLYTALELLPYGQNRIPSKDAEGVKFPEPVPIELNGRVIGGVIGSYYDGHAPGIHLMEAPIPPYSVAFTVKDVFMDDLARDSLRISGNDFVSVIKAFQEEPDEYFFPETPHPVFYNQTDAVHSLCIVKSHPFRPQDRDQIDIWDGFAWNPKEGYKSPRRVPQCG